MTISTREYGYGTELRQSYPWGLFVGGKALCSDGKVRTLKRISVTADSFFSIPATIEVRDLGKRYTISGYVTIESLAGFSTDTELDPATVKFVAYQYGKNGDKIPRGKCDIGVNR
jgi:hypothetical protein